MTGDEETLIRADERARVVAWLKSRAAEQREISHRSMLFPDPYARSSQIYDEAAGEVSAMKESPKP